MCFSSYLMDGYPADDFKMPRQWVFFVDTQFIFYYMLLTYNVYLSLQIMRTQNMRNRYLGVIFSTIFIINIYGCTRVATSYVKPGGQELKTIKCLAVTVKGAPEITHVGAITNESSALMILFGPPAVILDTAIRREIDENTAEAINPKEIASKAHTMLINTLVENLQQYPGFDEVRGFDKIDAQYTNTCDAILDVKILNWGSRIKHSGSDVIIPFLDIHISMIRQCDNKLIWNEKQTVTYDTNHTLDDYKQQTGLFERDFTTVINKAGKQVATLLLNF